MLPLGGEECLAPTRMRLGLQRAALLKLLAHAPHRRHAEARKPRDLLRALALLVKFQNALAEGKGDRSHTPQLAIGMHRLSSYIIYGNALMSRFPNWDQILDSQMVSTRASA